MLRLKFGLEDEAESFKEAIQAVMMTSGEIWLNPKRFGSSYPVRQKAYAQWLVDGKSYMEKAATMIELGKL